MLNICQKCFAELTTSNERLHGLCVAHIEEEDAKIYIIGAGTGTVNAYYNQRIVLEGRGKKKKKAAKPAPRAHDVFHDNKSIFHRFRLRGRKV